MHRLHPVPHAVHHSERIAKEIQLLLTFITHLVPSHASEASGNPEHCVISTTHLFIPQTAVIQTLSLHQLLLNHVLIRLL